MAITQDFTECHTHFKAQEAAICCDLDCDMIFELSERVCPSCGSTCVIPVTALFAGNAKARQEAAL